MYTFFDSTLNLVPKDTIYMDAALDQLKNHSFPINEEDEVGLSPLVKARFDIPDEEN